MPDRFVTVREGASSWVLGVSLTLAISSFVLFLHASAPHAGAVSRAEWQQYLKSRSEDRRETAELHSTIRELIGVIGDQ